MTRAPFPISRERGERPNFRVSLRVGNTLTELKTYRFIAERAGVRGPGAILAKPETVDAFMRETKAAAEAHTALSRLMMSLPRKPK